MKIKFISSCVCLAVLSISAFADSDNFNTNKFTALQKFYYELGKKQAKKTYYEQGYRDATARFKKLLAKYAEKIEKLEAGKYLLEASKITYPEVYKTRTSDNGYQIHIEAPTVERRFTSEDLFIVPLQEKRETVYQEKPHILYPNDINTHEGGITDGFSIPSMNQNNNNVPSLPKDLRNKVYVEIKHKSSNIKQFLDAYNANYAVTDQGYQIEFKNEAQKRKFCTELTGEASCYGLN